MSFSKEQVVMTAGVRTCLRSSWAVFCFAAIFLIVSLPAAGRSQSFTTIDGTIGPGALYQIAMPTGPWNGELAVYVHGMVPPTNPVRLPVLGSLRDTLTSQGFALIYSSFSVNGYAAMKDGAQRTHQLRGIFTSRVGRPTRVYLVGGSLGGLIAVMLAERFPDQYDGVLSLAGLLGGGAAELRYVSDAKVLFDYFFPGVLPAGNYMPPGIDFNPGGPTYTAVFNALTQGLLPPSPTLQFASTAKLPGNGVVEIIKAGMTVAGFIVTYTNDTTDLTNGHIAYDNTETTYSGSLNDDALNAGVARYASDPSAVNYFEHYYTPTGELHIPVISLHTMRDPLVPVFHETMYAKAVDDAGASQYLLQRTFDVFGHLNLQDADVAAAFFALVDWVHTGIKPAS